MKTTLPILFTTLIGLINVRGNAQQINFGGNRVMFASPTAENIFVGFNVGNNTTSGIHNAFLGHVAGQANTTGGNNSFLGAYAGNQNTTGSENAFLGYQSGFLNQSGNQNTALGAYAGYSNTSGGNNVFMGYQSGYKNTTAGSNVFIGNQAGYNNLTGTGNLFLGNQAGSNSNGSYNLFMGNGAGGTNTTGEGNTAIGDGSFLNSTSGTENTAIGRYAGINNTTGSRNTFIGTAASNPVGSGNLTNATAIGYNASVTASNALVLGNNQVNVGIGNSAPNNKLEITKGVANQSGLRFTNLTSTSPSSILNYYKFLTVNANGDVILASISGAAREGETESFWQRKGSFLQSTQNDAVIIGNNVAKTPVGYKLFVEEGILTEKVKVAVKNTSDWSDYVLSDTYRLRPLSEVERYVTQHGHLPDVPSANEVVEQGIDVAKMDATLLAKIEELTRYSIELEKKVLLEKQNRVLDNEKQQAEIDELKRLVKQLLEKK
ncbi:hypothetical protein GCM10028807_44090 [Spirosoma daeguense]